MTIFNTHLFRTLTLCLLLLSGIHSAQAQGQKDTATYRKFVVDKDKKKAPTTDATAAMALPPPPPGSCTLSGPSSVTGGSSTTYTLSCDNGMIADWWYVSCGTITSWWGNQVTIQWNSPGCTSATIRAYAVDDSQLASKTVSISGSTALSGGTISNSSQTITSGSTPAQLSATSASGGSCTSYSYQWQQASSINGLYANISGATGQNYQPGPLTATTYFKRQVSCGASAAFTNIATITVTAPLYGGYATNPSQTINPGEVPTLITATPASGGNCSGAYSYQWYQQTATSGPTDIPGATGQNYQPGALTTTTYFGRRVTCNGVVAYMETNATVTVRQPLNPGCITTADQQVLFGNTPAPIYATPASEGNCSGNYAYQWQSSTDNNYFSNIPGATSQNLNFSSPLTQTTYFQRKATCGPEVKYTGSVKVIMTATITYYNKDTSATFTRNCPTGQVGSSVVYTVPAGKHSSTISQVAANDLAKNDILTNGQAYADSVGTCTATGPVTITLKNLFLGSSYPASITVKFKQGSTVVQTNTFSSLPTGSRNISLPAGTYQMEFNLPSGYGGYIVSFDLNSSQYWDNVSNRYVVTTGNVVFSYGTAYTITASDAM